MISDKEKALSKLNPQTQKYQEELDDMIAKKKQLEDDIEVLKAQIEDADEQISIIDEQLAGTEQVAGYHKEQIAIEAEIEKLSEDLKTLEDERLSIIKKYYVLLMFYDSNSKTKGYIADKEAKGNLPPDIDRDLILKSIKEKKCAICKQDITGDIARHFDELLEKFSVSSGVSNKLMEIKNDVIACCEEAEKYREKREEINKKIRETEETIKARKDREEELNRKMSGVSNIEDIESLIKDKKRYKSLRDTNAEKIGNYKEQINQKNTDIDLKRAQIERATQQDEQSNNLKEQLIFLKAARDVVKSIEDEVVNEIKQEMEQETFSIFSRLIWKKNTYQRIEFSDTYKLKLFHVHGDSCLGSCSAAERELLALAFTLALHKVSHHDSLLFIDTPVGRVSDQNRSFFAQSIVEVSKNKQVILAFTPSEYSSEISECFDFDASSKATLKTTSEITTIVK
jgi:DNA sulfur modification protein DndD